MGISKFVGHVTLSTFLVLFCSVFLLFFLIITQTVRDPDTFYHAAFAREMLTHGFIYDFQALPFTTLAGHFSDHHFLYHVFLMPFVGYFDPLTGIKVAHVILCVILVGSVYFTVRKYFVGAGALAVVLLLTNGPFLLRITLPKAVPVGIIFILLSIACSHASRWKLLFVFSFLFSLSYGAYPVLPVLFGMMALEEWFHDGVASKKWSWNVFSKSKSVAVSLLGILSGTLLHPYFPNHLRFLYEQFGRIALLQEAEGVEVGKEWIGVSFGTFWDTGVPIIVFLIPILVVLLLRYKEIPKDVRSYGILCITFLVLSFYATRFLEFFAPFAVVFIASGIPYLAETLGSVKTVMLRRLFHPICGSVFVILLAVVMVRDLYYTIPLTRAGPTTTRFESSTKWLASNVDAGEIVFHPEFDLFPYLFYHAPQLRYIAGLDPRFLYFKDPKRYSEWRAASTGRSEDIERVISQVFESNWVFVPRQDSVLWKALEKEEGFVREYSGEQAFIYRKINSELPIH